MKALLLCPSEQPAIKLLSQTAPPAAMPLLGQGLLEYWLSHLALAGATHVRVLAHDRPEHIRAVVGEGARWGLTLEVQSEPRDLTAAQAMLKYAPELTTSGNPAALTVVDHFPGMPGEKLFNSYAEFFSALCRWIPHGVTPDRVGVREVKPGVWLSTHARVSPEAKLNPPCWIGERAFVGAGAVIGPNAVVETGAFVEPAVELVEGWIGPDTFVGQFARLTRSLAIANELIHWPSGTATTVFDPFLLCAVRRPRRLRGPGWLDRAAGLYSRNKEDVLCLWKQLLLHKEG